jgi:hypothetical protein
MALREFTAADGTSWRVWDVTSDKLHPATRAEDYLANYLDGWLVFESFDGAQKSRLFPIPAGWSTATDGELEALLRRAEAVHRDRMSPAYGRRVIEEARKPIAPTGHTQARTFRFPDGRHWSVTEWTDTAGSRPILRFSSGARSLDLTEWPSNWVTFTDGELVTLLAESFPRPPASNVSEHRRRRGDRDAR